jgi:hypothetical protein
LCDVLGYCMWKSVSLKSKFSRFVSSNLDSGNSRRQSFGGASANIVNGAKQLFFDQGGRAQVVQSQDRISYLIINY